MIEVLIIRADFFSPTLTLVEYDLWRGGVLRAHYRMIDQYPIPSFLRIGLNFYVRRSTDEEHFYNVQITCYFPRFAHEMKVKRYARRYRRGLYKALRKVPDSATMSSFNSKWTRTGKESEGWVP